MAVEKPISLIQGDDHVVGFDLWQDLEMTIPAEGLTGYDFKMQVRRNPKAPVMLELSTNNGLIVIEEAPEKSSILLYFIKADTTDLPADTDLGYDIELTNGDYTQTLFFGTINLQAEYTK